MSNAREHSAGPSPRKTYKPRPKREAGIPLHVRIDSQYVPAFPNLFRDKNLTYGKSYDVFKSHYLQTGLYGPGALMEYSHLGLFEDLMYMAQLGERFWAADLAANRGVNAHTISRYLDRLENLRLITRIRNGLSFDRWVSILLSAPFEPMQMREQGPPLMRRVTRGFVQKERDKAGKGRWPLLHWDSATMAKALAGESSSLDLKHMVAAIDVAYKKVSHMAADVRSRGRSKYPPFPDGFIFGQGGRNNDYDQAFRELVRLECKRNGWTYSQKLLITAVCVDLLYQQNP